MKKFVSWELGHLLGVPVESGKEKLDGRRLGVCVLEVGGVVEVRPAGSREAQARDPRMATYQYYVNG